MTASGEQMREYRVRPANIADLDAIVALHMRCFTTSDNIAMQFGHHFIRTAYRWFLTSDMTAVLVADTGSELAGLTAISDRPYSVPMLRACWKAAGVGLLQRPWLLLHPDLLQRLATSVFLRRHEHYTDGKSAQIAFTAVSPSYRRRGIATSLREEAFRLSQQRGREYMISAIRRDNGAMRQVAEKSGFIVAEELSNRTYVHMVKHLRTKE